MLCCLKYFSLQTFNINDFLKIFSEIPSSFIGEIVDLLDNKLVNLVHARKIISKIFDEKNKSPSQVSSFFNETNKKN